MLPRPPRRGVGEISAMYTGTATEILGVRGVRGVREKKKGGGGERRAHTHTRPTARPQRRRPRRTTPNEWPNEIVRNPATNSTLPQKMVLCAHKSKGSE
jgi:hypothetical protein